MASDKASGTLRGYQLREMTGAPLLSKLLLRGTVQVLRHDGVPELLFVNRRGRPLSANKLREKQLHPLLAKLGIERGGFHSLRHGAASSLLADGATPAVVQRQLRHSDARITLEVYGHVIGDDLCTLEAYFEAVGAAVPIFGTL